MFTLDLDEKEYDLLKEILESEIENVLYPVDMVVPMQSICEKMGVDCRNIQSD